MKKLDLIEMMKLMNKKHREIFIDLTLAYLNGEITKEQLRECYEGTETYEEIRQRYAGVKAM